MSRPPKQEQEQAGTDVTEVAPAVLRMQLPISLPGLGHVNAYALIDSKGAAVVDPGLPGPATWKALRSRLAQAAIPLGRIHTVVVTHSHPDHFGTAGRLAEEAGAELVTHGAFHSWWTRRGQHVCSDEDHPDVDPADVPTSNPFMGPTPWGTDWVKPPLKRRLMFQAMKLGLFGGYVAPKPTRRLKDGEAIELAGRTWTAVHTPGHTLDHLCLHDRDSGVLLSGDHVLPTITPHIGGLGTGRDPLKAFVASLDKVAALPGVSVVLPAHGHPFTDLAGRAAAIKRHHHERLEVLHAAAAAMGPSTVTALSHELFRPARWGAMAESETYAHLEHLRLAGAAQRVEQNGEMLYSVSEAGPAD